MRNRRLRPEHYLPGRRKLRWQAARARRLAVLIDNQSYFAAALAAIRGARRSIWLLGWEFDPRVPLDPDNEMAVTIGEALNDAVRTRPDLDVRLLVWDAPLPVSAALDFFPQRAPEFLDPRIVFRLDPAHEFGASQHQKVLVIDEETAFCSGDDFLPGRWDTSEHLDHDARRGPGHEERPYHGLTMLVDGAAAASLGELFRMRWRLSTGEDIASPLASPSRSDPPASWPRGVAEDMRDVDVEILRTWIEPDKARVIQEGLSWYLAAIRRARTSIYIENQYATQPALARALARRLRRRKGPEIVMILADQAPTAIERAVMDPARDAFVRYLRRADRWNRFRAFAPHAVGGAAIFVHAKCMIVDGEILRIGSANFNNRSVGYDTECDLAVAASSAQDPKAAAAFISRLQVTLLAHFLRVAAEEFEGIVERTGSLIAGIEAVNSGRELLRPITPPPLGFFSALTAAYHLGDPVTPADAMQPWSRRSGPALSPIKPFTRMIQAIYGYFGRWAGGRSGK